MTVHPGPAGELSADLPRATCYEPGGLCTAAFAPAFEESWWRRSWERQVLGERSVQILESDER